MPTLDYVLTIVDDYSVRPRLAALLAAGVPVFASPSVGTTPRVWYLYTEALEQARGRALLAAEPPLAFPTPPPAEGWLVSLTYRCQHAPTARPAAVPAALLAGTVVVPKAEAAGTEIAAELAIARHVAAHAPELAATLAGPSRLWYFDAKVYDLADPTKWYVH